MSRVAYGYAYFDPTNGLLVNSVGSTKEEASVNLSMIDLPEDRAKEIALVAVEISYDPAEEVK